MFRAKYALKYTFLSDYLKFQSLIMSHKSRGQKNAAKGHFYLNGHLEPR
jgi:hypothetical protein